MNNTRRMALEHGGTLVLALKFLFALALAGLAVSDKNTTFLTEKTGLVIAEAVVVGAGSAAAFAFIGWNRHGTDLIKICTLAFLVFFGVHFLLELSGFNTVEETTASKKLKESTGRAAKSGVAKALVIFVALTLFLFTMCGWDSPFNGASDTWRIPGVKGFGLEGLVFALCSALPFIMIVKDRGGSGAEAMKEFIKYFFLFGFGHLGLQYGGLYREAGFMKA